MPLGSGALGLSRPFVDNKIIGAASLHEVLNDQGFVARIGDAVAISFAGSSADLTGEAALDRVTSIAPGTLGRGAIAAVCLPLFDAALQCVQDNGIDRILLSDHSRGGALAEYFHVTQAVAADVAGLSDEQKNAHAAFIPIDRVDDLAREARGAFLKAKNFYRGATDALILDAAGVEAAHREYSFGLLLRKHALEATKAAVLVARNTGLSDLFPTAEEEFNFTLSNAGMVLSGTSAQTSAVRRLFDTVSGFNTAFKLFATLMDDSADAAIANAEAEGRGWAPHLPLATDLFRGGPAWSRLIRGEPNRCKSSRTST